MSDPFGSLSSAARGEQRSRQEIVQAEAAYQAALGATAAVTRMSLMDDLR